jgi:hypothetical protein
MLSQKTVLVLGAGASCEIGLPVGTELLSQISKLIEFRKVAGEDGYSGGDLRLLGYALARARENDVRTDAEIVDDLASAATQLRQTASFSDTIDAALANFSNPTARIVAKIAIFYILLDRERRSALFIDRWTGNVDLAQHDVKEKTWYAEFVGRMFEGVKISQVEECISNLRIVSFNYDRCFQQYLRLNISHRFHIPLAEATELTGRLAMSWPYGTLGRLPGEIDGVSSLEFGASLDERFLPDFESIRTFADGTGAERNGIPVAEVLKGASQVILLGCGYHIQNLEILRGDASSIRRLYLTTYGVQGADYERALDYVNSTVLAGSKIKPIAWSNTTKTFMDEHARDLMRHEVHTAFHR